MKILASLGAICALATPASAMSVVSLHGGAPAFVSSAPDLALVTLSVVAVAAVIALRIRRSAFQK